MSVAAEIIMIESWKNIELVAAIILKDGRLFAAQHGYGEWKDCPANFSLKEIAEINPFNALKMINGFYYID